MQLVLQISLALGLLTNSAMAQRGGPDFEAMNKRTQADHRQMLDQLGITQLRPGVNGNDPQAHNAANYDETKANPFPVLPEQVPFPIPRSFGPIVSFHRSGSGYLQGR